MKVKLCGFTDEAAVIKAVEYNADYIGFVFYQPSPRFVFPKKAQELANLIPPSIKKVAVTVNASEGEITEILQTLKPDFFQLHGNEDIQYIKNFREKFPQEKIIKAFGVKNAEDLLINNDFANLADYFLFDVKSDKEFGGTGTSFNWKLLNNFASKKDYFLSGGINANNIEEALKTSAFSLDISSGIEEEKGKKSPRLIAELMEQIKKLQNVSKKD